MKLMYKMFIFVLCFGMVATLVAALSGSGGANRLAYWSGTDTLTYDNDFSWNNTHHILGIGEPVPVICNGCTGPGIHIRGGNPGVRYHDLSGTGADYLQFANDERFYIWDLTEKKSVMIFKYAGRVGINTDDPIVALDVNGQIRTRAQSKGNCNSDTVGIIGYEVVSNVGTFYGCAQTGASTYEWKSLQN